MTSEEICGAITKHHKKYQIDSLKVDGILIFELHTNTGYAAGEPSKIDAWFMAETITKGLRRIAYEVKVSRSDFLRELADPRKRRAALRVSNQFYFVMPPGIAKTDEIPLECGLMEVYEEGRLHEKVAAPYRDGEPANWLFLAAVMRRLMRGNFITTEAIS